MIINGKRALVYIVNIDEVKPIEGYDRVEYARTGGWWCIVGKGELEEKQKVVYFEVDSLVPSSDKRFAFLEKRKFRIKTQKMCGGRLSQGLLMSLESFPEFKDLEVGTDVQIS